MRQAEAEARGLSECPPGPAHLLLALVERGGPPAALLAVATWSSSAPAAADSIFDKLLRFQ